MKTIEETLGLELVTNEYLVRKLRERAADEEWTGGDEAEAHALDRGPRNSNEIAQKSNG
jgi:hypothetical protein